MRLLILMMVLFSSLSKVEWQTPLEHDFGDILYRDSVEYAFTFKNISDEAILIDNVRTTCGCTAPDWTYDAIPPDSTSSIRVVFDADKRGAFRKKITVFFSGQRKSEKLYVEGFVE